MVRLPRVYGYFFRPLFEPVTDPADARLGELDAATVQRLCAAFLNDYRGAMCIPGASHRQTFRPVAGLKA